MSAFLRSECITSLHENGATRRNVISCNSGELMRKRQQLGKSEKSSKMETVLFSLFDLFLKQTSSAVSPQALRKDLPSCTKPT